MTIGNRILSKMKENNYSEGELSRLSGVPQPSIHRLVSNEVKSPNINNVTKIANALKIELEWLLTGKESIKTKVANYVDSELKKKSETIIEIPQFDVSASMGAGRTPHELTQTVNTISVMKDFFVKYGIPITAPTNLAIVTGIGDSMETTFQSGDPLVIDQGIKTFVEDGVYLFTLGDMLYIKRLQRLPKCIKMISDNKNYAEYDIQGEELKNLIIHGKVLFAWNGRRV